MHIPDGFLTPNVFLPAWLVSGAGVAYCFKRVTKKFQEKMIPLMGVTSAFVFAAQMINFPVAGGTSGHLLGGVLAAILLGPFASAISISIVLTAQCFLFQDGGLTALGANIFNMSFAGTIGGFLIYKTIRTFIRNKTGTIIATAVASWTSVVLASIFCAFELAMSGTSPLQVVLPAMISVHVLIGIGEAVITTLIINFILKVRPDLIYE